MCTNVDADGDKWMERFETGAEITGKWVATGGTGKYEELAASGNYASVGETPPAAPGAYNKCNRNTGTYRLR